ncbi:sigma 54-interacting transcriptional regulator [Kosmotoga pacifica]|uniref:Fis family transcriptional regulator n=1 Tax=Kosmotoga pacifica TaxID=1330330 RepID=A0A0G2Z5E4_9BACT|nr:sigma 54-interacting transcriptional regulator [Kosmotoga pacifica]AKI96840.1 Fis family transcriptional regulator [Kosmotoga pacifica]
MYYRAIMIGEDLKDIDSFDSFSNIYELDFDYLVNMEKDIPTLLFIDGAPYDEKVLQDWLYAFTNIILINNNPIRAFILRGYSEECNLFKGYYRVMGSYKSSRQLAREIIERIDTQLMRIVGESDKVVKLKKMLVLSMFYDGSVMILGETGTGKNLLAEVIAKLSPRWDKPFYSMNCAAIPETLLESELFGYKKGAFTGASTEKTGLVEQANTGTLFLDEIGDMPLNLQAKILSITENREFFKIGDTKPKKVDVRFITATNRTEDTALRNDLRFRLSAIKVELPPLRERKSDIPLIFDSVLKSKGYLLTFEGLSPELKEIFMEYDYPGNVRELLNMIEEFLAVNTVVYMKTNKNLEELTHSLAEEARILNMVKGITYKEFLNDLHKRITKELLKQRAKALEYNISSLSEEFGLTPRRIRDLLNEFGVKGDSD